MECFYDNHPNILGSITIESAQSFPILFEILIDETPILKNCFNGFYLFTVYFKERKTRGIIAIMVIIIMLQIKSLNFNTEEDKTKSNYSEL